MRFLYKVGLRVTVNNKKTLSVAQQCFIANLGH